MVRPTRGLDNHEEITDAKMTIDDVTTRLAVTTIF